MSLVDWEYAGENHRSYDLAFFSIKKELTPVQESQFLKSYDAEDSLNTRYNVSLMKPVIIYLSLLWQLLKSKEVEISSSQTISSS